jgi:NADPH:quinone reductase-like Zn-dependent oxidoreductase
MAQPLPPLRDGEVTVQIKAVGLNLRDVLLAMGYVLNDKKKCS